MIISVLHFDFLKSFPFFNFDFLINYKEKFFLIVVFLHIMYIFLASKPILEFFYVSREDRQTGGGGHTRKRLKLNSLQHQS